MRIGIDCGHTANGPGSGASGYLNESRETRVVGRKVMEILRQAGHTVFDCTNDVARSVSENLRNICRSANAQRLDAFYSIHFNAGGGQGSEVYTMTGTETPETARILDALAELGFRNRGTKKGSHLYVINRTDAPATLIEVCFVDSKTDADLYRKVGADTIAQAIAKAIMNENLSQEEDLTMTQYQELKQEIKELTETVKILTTEVHNLKHPMIYNYIDENMPKWARDSVKKVVDKGILKGDENGLGLTYNDLRQIVMNDRAGLYD